MDTLILFLRDYGWFIGPPLLIILVAARVFHPSVRARYRKDGEIPFDG
ncbi:MAG: hypothetical protein ACK4SR_04670 [Thiobacillus sp.]